MKLPIFSSSQLIKRYDFKHFFGSIFGWLVINMQSHRGVFIISLPMQCMSMFFCFSFWLRSNCCFCALSWKLMSNVTSEKVQNIFTGARWLLQIDHMELVCIHMFSSRYSWKIFSTNIKKGCAALSICTLQMLSNLKWNFLTYPQGVLGWSHD